MSGMAMSELEEIKLQEVDKAKEGKYFKEDNIEVIPNEKLLNNYKNESARSSNNLIENYAISPRKLAEYRRQFSLKSCLFLLSGSGSGSEDSEGASKSGTFYRPSLSRLTRRFVTSPKTLHRRSGKPTWSLAHLSLQDLIFRQKLQLFIKNLRNHSGLNDNTRLNLGKLRIINDKGAIDSEVLNQNATKRAHRHKRLYEKILPHSPKHSIQNIVRDRIGRATNIIVFWSKTLCSILDDKFPVLKPLSKFIIIWDFIMLALTLWNLISFSLILSFKISMQESFSFSISYLNNTTALAGFQISCLILYYIDIILKFNTSYYSDGEAVKNRKKIMANYLRGGLLFDLLGTIPFLQYMVEFERGGSYMLCFFLFKVYPLQVFFRNINEALLNFEGKLESGYQLIKLLLTVLIVCHVFACLWHFQALQGNEETSWIEKQGLQNHYWPARYLRSLYFTVVTMTTVGYGDISPSNTTEYLIAMACALIGSGLIGYSISSIGAILKEKNKAELEFRKKMQLINGYLKKYKVSEDLKIRVRKYVEYIWKIENSENEKKCEEILKELPISLREDLLIQSRLWTVQSLFSSHFKKSTVNRILNALVHTQYSKEEWIFQEGDNSDNSLYIVAKGKVALILNQGKPSKSKLIEIDLKMPGEHFDLHSFILNAPKPYSAKAKSVCSLFKLGRREFLDILKENQEDFEKFCMIRDKSFLNRDLSAFGQRCKSCGEPFHILLNCPYLCYKPFKPIIIKKHLFSKVQKRSKFKRKNKTLFSNPLGKANALALLEETKGLVKTFQESRNDLIKELEALYVAYRDNFPCFSTLYSINEERTMESKVFKDDTNIHGDEVQKQEFASLGDFEKVREFKEGDEYNSLLPIIKSVLPSLSYCSPEPSKNELNNDLAEYKQIRGESKLNKPSNFINQHEEFKPGLLKILGKSVSRKRSKTTSIDFEQNEEELDKHEEQSKPLKIHTLITTNSNNKSVRTNPIEPLFSRDMDMGHSFSFYFPDSNKADVIVNLTRMRGHKIKRNTKYY